MHKYEELTPYEFDREKERASIIYLSAGPLEFHEECNAVGIDLLKGYDWCLGAAEITGGIVYPALSLAPQTERSVREGVIEYMEREGIRSMMAGRNIPGRFPSPSQFTSVSVCRSVYRELLECFSEDMGFRLCVFVGSHGPAGDLCREIVREAGGSFGEMKVMAVGSLDYCRDFILEEYAVNCLKICHGGLWETAFNYAMNPEYVQFKYLDPPYPQKFGPLAEDYHKGSIRPVRREYRSFSPEFAEKLRTITVRRFAEDVLRTYNAIGKPRRSREQSRRTEPVLEN